MNFYPYKKGGRKSFSYVGGGGGGNIEAWVRSQCDGLGEYCGLSTASEVFLSFTTQLYSYFCNHNVIFFYILKRGTYHNKNTPNPQYSPLLTSSG